MTKSKLFWILSVVFVVFTSCSKDDDVILNDEPPQTSTGKIIATAKTTNLPPRLGFKMIDFKGEYWFMGGTETKEARAREPQIYHNDIWKSSDGETWVKVVDNAPWSKRSYFNLFQFDNKLWLIGGLDVSTKDPELPLTRLNDVWNSADGINWTKVTNQGNWQARALPFATAQDEKMYLIGGHTNTAWTLYQDIWESTNGVQWSSVGSINDNTLGASDTRNGIWKQSVVKLGDEYFMFGGSLSSSFLGFTSVLKSVDMLNWSVVTRNTPWKNEHYQSIEYLDPFVWKNKMYVVVKTKEYSEGTIKQIVFSSTDGATWSEELELPSFAPASMLKRLAICIDHNI